MYKRQCKDTRARLNAHEINYCDMHLSQLAQNLRYGFFGKMDMVVIEAGDVTEDVYKRQIGENPCTLSVL